MRKYPSFFHKVIFDTTVEISYKLKVYHDEHEIFEDTYDIEHHHEHTYDVPCDATAAAAVCEYLLDHERIDQDCIDDWKEGKPENNPDFYREED